MTKAKNSNLVYHIIQRWIENFATDENKNRLPFIRETFQIFISKKKYIYIFYFEVSSDNTPCYFLDTGIPYRYSKQETHKYIPHAMMKRANENIISKNTHYNFEKIYFCQEILITQWTLYFQDYAGQGNDNFPHSSTEKDRQNSFEIFNGTCYKFFTPTAGYFFFLFESFFHYSILHKNTMSSFVFYWSILLLCGP